MPATPPMKKKRTRKTPSQTKPHKRAKGTSTSTMPVLTPIVPVDVLSFEDSDSNDGVDVAHFSCSTSKAGATGPIGSRITCKHKGKSYMWESKTGTSAVKFIDIKIYDDPKAVRHLSPMEMWKHATFSAKAYIGNPLIPKTSQPILEAVKTIQNLIVEDFKARHPNLENPVQTSATKEK